MPVSFSDLSDEIVEKIFKHFHLESDSMSLESCSLTSRRLSSHARAVQFGSITIYCNEPDGFDQFTALLNSDPAYGPLVQNLFLQKRELSHTDTDPEHQIRPVVQASQISWNLLVNLRCITFTSIRLGSTQVFYDIVDALPSLTDVTCTDVVWSSDNGTTQPPPTRRTFEQLKKLCIQDGEVSPTTFMLGLQQRRNVVPLKLVTLHVDTNRLDDYRAWANLVRMSRSTLTSASLYTREAAVDDSLAAATQSGRFHEILLDGLKECSLLRELTLIHRFRKTDSSEATKGTLFEALCVHLASSVRRYPKLEILRLHLYDRDGKMVSVTPALVDRLTQALEDPLLFPSFRRLELFVTIQVWSPFWREWINDISEDSFEMAEERWSRALQTVFAAAPLLELLFEITD